MLIDDFKQQKLMVVVFGTSMHVYFKQEKLNTIFTGLVFFYFDIRLFLFKESSFYFLEDRKVLYM